SQLRELEASGVIRRKVYAEVPPKVEYSVTAYGKTLQPILNSMCDWGVKHRRQVQSRQAAAASATGARPGLASGR
ncbi:MAG: winged helix-turn-helix transcriptional regulator, partial [bacterium]|nr:winged helix-turn-helix transcriptional regulator [bacterium]